jgi:putative ABC transport system permease protein
MLAAVQEAEDESPPPTYDNTDRSGRLSRMPPELMHDIRYACRLLLKTPLFTTVAVLTLALGIGANTAIFSIVRGVLLKPLPYPQADRLVTLWQDMSARGGPAREWTTPGSHFDWKTGASVFSALTSVRGWQPTLTGMAEPESIVGEQVTRDYFDVVAISPALGRRFTPEDDVPKAARVAIVSHGLWQRRFDGDPGVVGRRVTLGGEPHEIIGVMPEHFRPAVIANAELWRPLRLNPANAPRALVVLRTIARLKPDVTLEQARTATTALATRLQQAYPDDYVDTGIAVIPMHDFVVGGIRDGLLALAGAVGFVLLIACVNIANLLLARASGRGREIAIRLTLGAARMRVVRQLLTESVLLAAIGGVAGVLVAIWAVEGLLAIAPAGAPRLSEVHLDLGVLTFAAVLTVATGILFGMVPALQAVRQNVGPALKDSGRNIQGGTGRTARRALIVAEVALALVLLVGGGLLIRTFLRLQAADLGFDPSNVLVGSILPPAAKYPTSKERIVFYDQLLERSATLPGVQTAALSSVIPLGGDSDMDIRIEGRPAPRNEAEATTSWYRIVSPRYFAAMGIPLVQGRDFSPREPAPTLVVNESFAAKWWPGQQPLGKRVRLGGAPDSAWFTIVGVAADVKVAGARSGTRSEMYVPYWHLPEPGITIVLKASASAASLTNPLKQAVREIDPDMPVANIAPMVDLVGESIGRPRFFAMLTGVFGAMALVLAAIGIYGVMSYTVAQRTTEIGVRMALGASGREVLSLIVADAVRLAVWGVAFGIGGALLVTRGLWSTLLFEVDPRDPATFGATAVLLLAVAAAASFLPARRATRVDPMVALRAE